MKPLKSLRNSKCRLCDLYSNAKHVCLMGKGPSDAKIMLLGEAPGEEEDKLGEPFIGKTGRMLDSILINIGLPRDTIYITHSIKCHPPYTSKPKAAIIDICTNAYLRREIREVRPELIVCLGGIAASVLIADGQPKVSDVRGSIRYTQGPMPQGIPFIVTYHPAATFHQPELLEFIVDDLEWAKRLINGELPKPKKKVRYVALDSIKDIPGIDEAKWVDLDLETDGLDPFIEGKDILSLQLSIKEGEGYYFDWNKRILRELRHYLSRSDIAVNGHNIKFDLKWLRVKFGVPYIGKLNDTIQNIHMLDENFQSKSLDTVATTFTELKGHKIEFVQLINNYIKMHKENKEPIRLARNRLWGQAYKAISLKTRIAYGCGDADATGRLRRRFIPDLKQQDLMPLHNMMMNVTKTYIDMEYNGVKVDEPALADMRIVYRKKLKKLVKHLDRLSPIEINHAGPLQVRQLLYGAWKLEPHEVKMGKKRVRYSTGKAALELLLNDDLKEEQRDYVTNLLEYRKESKLYGTYIVGMPRYLRNGYIHANWNLTGTDSGRTSCNDPNLQQIPRKGDINKLFISRYGRDGVIMEVDVSQGELRLAAHSSKEPTLTRLFREDRVDIHTAIAAVMFNKAEHSITEEERFQAKTVNFLILYGGGIKILAQSIKKDDNTAAKLLHTWYKRFPRWKEYVNEQEDEIVANHCVRSVFGRYRRLFILERDTKEGMMTLRKGINAPIQGGLGDYNKLCGYNVWSKLNAKRGTYYHRAKMIMEIHDAWKLDLPKKLVSDVAQIVKEEFENVDTSEFGFKFRVPMKVEIKVGPNGKDMEPYEL